jgi:hypothetical protein
MINLANAANEFGLPFIPPILGEEQNFTHGANFGVIGATALDLAFFLKNNITGVPPVNGSLNVQLDWFRELKPTLCSTPQGSIRTPSLCYLIKLCDDESRILHEFVYFAFRLQRLLPEISLLHGRVWRERLQLHHGRRENL